MQHDHITTNLLLFGTVDDIWIDTDGKLIVVDCKSTSTKKSITLDDTWEIGYERQLEFYQWLQRQSGFTVSDVGFFIYVNTLTDRAGLYERLDFETHLLAYRGSDKWVEPTVNATEACLRSDEFPASSYHCQWCRYRQEIHAVEQ